MNRRIEKWLLDNARHSAMHTHMLERFEQEYGRKANVKESAALGIAALKTIEPTRAVTINRHERRKAHSHSLRALRTVRTPQGPPPAEEASDG